MKIHPKTPEPCARCGEPFGLRRPGVTMCAGCRLKAARAVGTVYKEGK